MSKLLFLSVFLLVTTNLFSQDYCEICKKEVGIVNMGGAYRSADTMSYDQIIYRRTAVQKITSYTVCENCYNKYNPKLQSEIDHIIKSFFAHALKENKEAREKTIRDRKEIQLYDLMKQQKELNDKIKELEKNGIKPAERDSTKRIFLEEPKWQIQSRDLLYR